MSFARPDSRRSIMVAASLAACAAVFVPRLAAAQDLALAETLFTKGLKDMEAGNFDDACPALAESQRLDPRAGTLFTLAECEAKAGRIATAVARYEDYLRVFSRMTPDQQGKQQGREKISASQRDLLKPLVPELKIMLPANAPAGTVVTRDGVTLGAPAIGIPLPIDPGEHVLTTQPPSGKLHEQKVTIEKGEKKEVVLEVDLEAAAAPGGDVKDDGAAGGAGVTSDAPPPASRRTLAYAAFGVGGAGLVLGAVTGAITLGKKGTISDNCDGPICNQVGLDAANSAKTTGLLSTIGFGVGIVGAAVGAVLFFTEPKPAANVGSAALRKKRARPRLTADVSTTPFGGFASVRGVF